MIDTIGFSFPISESDARKVRAKGNEIQKKNFLERRIEFTYINSEVFVGSFSRKVVIRIKNCTLNAEFSVPKLVFGHNISLIDKAKTIEGIETLREAITREFEISPPPYKEWEIYRVDLCYAWKYKEKSQASRVLSILKNLRYLNFKIHTYPTSIMWVGQDYSIKFYEKNAEFINHDFKELHKNPKSFDRAYNLLEFSQEVLRFEVSMKKKHLNGLFGDRLRIDELLKYDLEGILSRYLYKVIRVENNMMGILKVQKVLETKFPPDKAVRLFTFYTNYYSDKPEERAFIIKNFDRRTIWLYLKNLREAGVGLPSDNSDVQLDLNIPSKDCVSNFA